MGLRRVTIAVLALCLAGCAGLAREAAPIGHPAAHVEGFEQVRIDASDPQLVGVLQRNLERTHALTNGPISVLSLSSGGAEGAYGAGVMVGWTRSGKRPQFLVVTGVSAGALIAPFAFLGPEWDPKLKEAFTGKQASGLLAPRGLAAIFGSSAFQGQPLENLVDSYVDDELIAAVAREHAKGRRLLVATTDLDRQATVIWNLGAIAERGGPKARQLFRDVLVASASIPGAFPPKMIQVTDAGQSFSEMHVDGGVSTPFFTVPPRALFWTDAQGLFRSARLYVIINGQVQHPPQTTSLSTAAVLGRSVDTVELTLIRTTLEETQGFCEHNGVAFSASALPADSGSSGPFDFSRKNRNRLFNLGERLGASGEAWNLARAKD